MTVPDRSDIDDLFNQVRAWPVSDRLRFARRILESLEYDPQFRDQRPPTRPFTDLLGAIKLDGPAPTDEECQAILEEELMKKHVR